jgi:type IV secretion system protein VirB4
MHRVVEEEAYRLGESPDDLRPEQWLERFYSERKGSGKDKPVPRLMEARARA